MSIFRTQTGQTGLNAYRYELAAIGNEFRTLEARYAKLIETIATEMPESATGSEIINEDLTLRNDASGLRTKLRMSASLTKSNLSYVGAVLKSVDQSSDDYKPVDPAAPVAPDLTPASLEIFLAYAEDAGNWSGNPWVDGNVSLDAAGRGNLTDLKRKGLLETQHDDGDAFVVFTDAGKALAAQHGIDLSWIA